MLILLFQILFLANCASSVSNVSCAQMKWLHHWFPASIPIVCVRVWVAVCLSVCLTVCLLQQLLTCINLWNQLSLTRPPPESPATILTPKPSFGHSHFLAYTQPTIHLPHPARHPTNVIFSLDFQIYLKTKLLCPSPWLRKRGGLVLEQWLNSLFKNWWVDPFWELKFNVRSSKTNEADLINKMINSLA